MPLWPPDWRRDPGPVGALIVTVVTAAAFAPAVGNGFVNYDDGQYVTDNPRVRNGLTADGFVWAWTTGHASNWHPLTWLSLQLDAALFGPDAAGFHGTNVLLHAAAAAVTYLAVRRLTGRGWWAAAVAALFAVHPLRVESVAWVAERKDVLSGLLFATTLYVYGWYAARPSLRRMTAVAGVFALGLASKPMLVTVPCVLLLLDYWPLGRLTGWKDGFRRAAEKWPLWLLSVVVSWVTVAVQARGGAVNTLADVSWYSRLSAAVVGPVMYLAKTVWPDDLAVLYPHPRPTRPLWEPAAAGLLLLIVTAAVVRCRRRHPYLLVGWLWFLGMLVPVSGLVAVGTQEYADRYTYLPHVGLFLGIVGWLASAGRVPPTVATAGVAVLVVVWAAVGVRQMRHWADSESLWTHAVAVTRDNPTARFNLALPMTVAGRWREAVPHLEEAVRIEPDRFDTRRQLALAYRQMERLPAAGGQAAAALAISTTDPAADAKGVALCHRILADSLAAAGRTDDAVASYRRAIAAEDGLPARNNLGVLLGRAGRAAEAAAEFAAAARLAPADPRAHLNLGMARLDAGDPGGAADALADAIRLDSPPAVQSRVARTAALLAAGRRAEAEAEAAAGRRLAPGWADAADRVARGFVTGPDPAGRRTAAGLELASLICGLTDRPPPHHLDTLAAGQAAAGQFAAAVATARRAADGFAAAGRPDLAADARERLLLYQSNRSLRPAPAGR